MTNLLKLPTWADDKHIFAVVETPRGSTCKLNFVPELGTFTLAKPLMAGLSYPYDWGFIPSTKAEDGDALDVLIIHDAQTYPGVVLPCRPVGVLARPEPRMQDHQAAVQEVSPTPSDPLFVDPNGNPFPIPAGNKWKSSLLFPNRPERPVRYWRRTE
jgi:inorganic pyrophosphatase